MESSQLGNDVTFDEFVQYLIDPAEAGAQNEHWQPMHELCQPCSVNYTYIARYERLMEHSELLLALIGAGHQISFPLTRSSGTKHKMPHYYAQLPLQHIAKLYHMYKHDFRLFAYELDDVIGYDIA